MRFIKRITFIFILINGAFLFSQTICNIPINDVKEIIPKAFGIEEINQSSKIILKSNFFTSCFQYKVTFENIEFWSEYKLFHELNDNYFSIINFSYNGNTSTISFIKRKNGMFVTILLYKNDSGVWEISNKKVLKEVQLKNGSFLYGEIYKKKFEQKNPKFSNSEFENLVQDVLNLNQFDYLYSNEDKNKGLSIVINNFIKPYYKNLKLRKFNKKVRFQTHKEIYSEKNEKFMDILDGSIFIRNDTLHIIIGLRYKHTALLGRFIKNKKGHWFIINKNSKPISKYAPNYDSKRDKEQCLAYKILINKFPNKLQYQKYAGKSCDKFNFEN